MISIFEATVADTAVLTAMSRDESSIKISNGRTDGRREEGGGEIIGSPPYLEYEF